MKYCQECGRMLRDADDSCPYCGTYQDIIMNAPIKAFDVNEGDRNTGTQYSNSQYSGTQYSDYQYSGMNNGSMYGDFNDTPFYEEAGPGMGSDYYAGPADGGAPIKRYGFAKIIILSILTLGIYGLIVNYRWTKDINRLCKGVDKDSPNFIVVILLGLVTFGIYSLYWIYKQSERMKETGYRNGVIVEDSGAQNLLLTLFGGGIGALVVWYILYHNTNRLSAVFNGDESRDTVNRNYSHRNLVIVAVIIAVLGVIIALVSSIVGALFSVMNDSGSERIEDIIGGDEPGYYFDDEEDMDDFLNDEDYAFNPDDYISQGKEADFGDYTLSIDKALNIYDYDNQRALAVTFTWTNNSDEEASALWVFDIRAFQNEHELVTTWPKMNDKDVSIDEYLLNIQPGETKTFQVMFAVENDQDPVTIRATTFFDESDIMAEHIFTITDGNA